ncbi:tRNA-specific adenosine deaminase [Endomicrobiia bacterium]|uniref:tRNA adenosine(34) deaminase TadA n=1 Tax=Endomicrobium trichonymphae TaxID=1408204 RepID=UPI0018D51279|nr:tRNA adenosine(34) deaminase TadA [Candidatus Endomicrobium trichonymphae]GHT15328.1 tRNA-specific adenosine deaminase [Endomicrobiia bacterium]GHT23752.1 tRNA-specific adenosine deaminase [Endomicrobiia bacterium]
MKNKQVKDDAYFMFQALKEASKARESREVPIGAVIVKDNKIIARGFNKCIALSDPTAHAEIVALRKAAKKLKNYRLNDCYAYATIEPCVMCAGALAKARIKKIIFGAFDKKAGCYKNILKTGDIKKLSRRLVIVGKKEKHLSAECANIIKDFFKKIRQQKA